MAVARALQTRRQVLGGRFGLRVAVCYFGFRRLVSQTTGLVLYVDRINQLPQSPVVAFVGQEMQAGQIRQVIAFFGERAIGLFDCTFFDQAR